LSYLPEMPISGTNRIDEPPEEPLKDGAIDPGLTCSDECPVSLGAGPDRSSLAWL
jgi:hypothetical protein